jgi:hypothetical protein
MCKVDAIFDIHRYVFFYIISHGAARGLVSGGRSFDAVILSASRCSQISQYVASTVSKQNTRRLV